ncbi:MAG: hypothetical protein K0S66_2964 [Sphingomonas sp.]|jgi:hypothetical protein|nr:hypothetical protein [Sphingomonas sp.]
MRRPARESQIGCSIPRPENAVRLGGDGLEQRGRCAGRKLSLGPVPRTKIYRSADQTKEVQRNSGC